MPSPSANHLVIPVSIATLRGDWDPDSQHTAGRGSLQPHTIQLAYDPLTTPRIAIEDGIRYPVPDDLQPRLAVSWGSSDDRRTWTIQLRQGVRSPFGNELTSEDIKWSWDRLFALKGVGLWRARRAGGLDSSENVEPIGRYTVRFTLPSPNSHWPQFLIFPSNLVVDSVAARRHSSANDPWATEWLAETPAGFGPFDLAERTPNRLLARAREDYWAGEPGVQSFEQVGVDHREAGLRMLDRGEANVGLGLYPEELARFAGRRDCSVARVRANHATLEFNWLAPPFDDQRVRQAVAYALPYGEILEKVYAGSAQPSKSHLCKVTAGYTEQFWHYDTDLEQARECLRGSAYPDGFSTQLFILPSSESLRFGEVARQALKAIGIDVEVRLIGGQQYGTKVPMWFYEECSHALNEAMYDLAHEFVQPAGMNAGRSPRDERWVDRLRQIRRAEAADQPAMLRDIQRDLLEFLPSVPIAEIQTGWVFREPVDPWALSPQCLSISGTVWSGHRTILPML